MGKTEGIKPTKFGTRNWVSAIIFGLVGQIAWCVENMYFATFAQDIFKNSGLPKMSYIVTTLMVILSALMATVTTIFAGALCDKLGKRKPFISYGYIAWGVTIMIFAVIPMRTSPDMVWLMGAVLVIFDCVMTLAGSTSNDAAFNAWLMDTTDTTNRGKVNIVQSLLSVLGVLIVFVALGPLYDSEADNNSLFFIILGIIPLVAGFAAIFLLKDSPDIVRNSNPDFLKETFFGFRPSVIKANKMLFVSCLAACILGTAQQTFFSYLINFMQYTLGLGDKFVFPVALIILGASVVAGVMGFLFDKFGRKRFYLPLLVMLVIGLAVIYSLKFMDSSAYLPLMYGVGIPMLGAVLSLGAAMLGCFQDYVPRGAEGRFQGVRMVFVVLLPMIIGPIISMAIGIGDLKAKSNPSFAPPFDIFIGAAVVAALSAVPLYFVRKDSSRLRNSLLELRDENIPVQINYDEMA